MTRLARIAPLIGLTVALAVSPGGASSSLSVPFGGVVRDVLGRSVAEVEILVLPEGETFETIGSAVTDDAGRFRVADLPPGTYRLAALKPGYLAVVGRVDTSLKSTLDLVLRPAPRPGEPGHDRVRNDRSWMLRLPERSVLRETDPEQMVAAGGRPGPDRGPRWAPDLGGQVEHVVAVRRPGVGSSDGASIDGGETALRLYAGFDSRTSMSLAGRRSRFETAGDSHRAAPAGRLEGTLLRLDVSHETDGAATLDFRAYVDRAEAGLGPVPGGPALESREGRRSWGYGASWAKQVDRESRVAFEVGFVGAELDLGDGAMHDVAPLTTRSDPAGLVNRAASAEGRYESMAIDGHRMRVGLRAQMLDLDVPSVRGGQETAFLGIVGNDGYSLHLDVADAWTASPPFALTYGLSVLHAMSGVSSTVLAPKTGVTWSHDRWRAEGTVAYYDVASSSYAGRSPGDLGGLQPADRWGYDAEVSAGLGAGVRVKAFTRYAPLRMEALDAGAGWSGDEALLAAGGNASDRRTGVTVELQGSENLAYLRVIHGSASGFLADAVSRDLPLRFLADRDVRYSAGEIGTRLGSTGTDVALAIHRIDEQAIGPSPGTAGTDSSVAFVEVTVGQTLARMPRAGASCRLLISGRASVVGDEGGDSERNRLLAALNDRIGAGVVFVF